MKFELSLIIASWFLLVPSFARLGAAPSVRKLQGSEFYSVGYSCSGENVNCVTTQTTSSLGPDEVYMTASLAANYGANGPYNFNLCGQETSVEMILDCDPGQIVSDAQLVFSSHITCNYSYGGDNNPTSITCTNWKKECEFVQMNQYSCVST